MEFRNIAAWDRISRLGLGGAMLVIGWSSSASIWLIVFRILALYPLITGLSAWCPMYTLLRVDSRQIRQLRATRPPADDAMN